MFNLHCNLLAFALQFIGASSEGTSSNSDKWQNNQWVGCMMILVVDMRNEHCYRLLIADRCMISNYTKNKKYKIHSKRVKTTCWCHDRRWSEHTEPEYGARNNICIFISLHAPLNKKKKLNERWTHHMFRVTPSNDGFPWRHWRHANWFWSVILIPFFPKRALIICIAYAEWLSKWMHMIWSHVEYVMSVYSNTDMEWSQSRCVVSASIATLD